mmetsp:Transcript_83869/g.179778  ORF Transcript_83869/g.179778 Transcript_83869/m.179778 type:complete len:278 (+) Transcript_83869:148-981(+)
MATAITDRVDDGLAHLGRHVAPGAAQVKVAIILVDELVDHLLLLLKAVRDVDLLLLLAAQRQDDMCEHAVLLVLVELFLVAVLLAIPGAEEEGHLAALLTRSLSCHTLLNKGPHGSDACAQGHHHHRGHMGVRHRHCGGVHAAAELDALSGNRHLVKPARGETHAVPAAGGGPVVPDDAEMALIVAPQPGGGGDGVQARLDVRHIIEQGAHTHVGAGELLQELCVGVALSRVGLVVRLALASAEVFQLRLLLGIRGAKLQHLVETALWPATDVHDLS